MIRKFISLGIVVTLSLLFLSTEVFAAGGGGGDRDYSPSSKDSENFKKGKSAVQSEQYEEAIGHLLKASYESPKNADVFNLLGFSHRKLGNFDRSLNYYNKALEIDPKHRGANEYIGELFLQTNKLEEAEKHLKILDKVCWFGCEEYDKLKAAIAKYKAAQSGG